MHPSDTPHFDVGIHGGSLAGIAAALELKRAGYSVWLSSHRNYLGEDLCDPLRLRLPEDLDTTAPHLERLFTQDARAAGHFRPMALKHALDEMLAESGVPVFPASAPGEVLVDGAGALRGLSLCDRAGRRLLGCRVLVDATVQGDLLRLGGVALTPPDAQVEVVRRAIGGETDDPHGWRAEGTVRMERGEDTLWAFRARLPLRGPSWGDWMDLEQRTRIEAFRRGQTLSADGIEAFSGERLQPGIEPSDADANSLPVAACTALNECLWVLGQAANVTPDIRERLKRPDCALRWGQTLGARIATALRATVPSTEAPRSHAWCSLSPARVPSALCVCDLGLAGGPLPGDAAAVHAVEQVDVVVAGGGTGGAPAAIAAARSGARTLVAEFLSGLGGVGTLGLIGKYWFGVREGFTAEVDAGAAALTTREFEPGSWDVEAKMHWYHREITAAGGSIWYKTSVCGALLDGNRVAGVLLATPRGRVAVLARCTVDATGSADVAAAAGARTVAVGDGHLAMQGTGLPGREPGRDYTNTDYDFIDDSDTTDQATAHATARAKFKTTFDAGQLVDSRERRRIVGDIEISPMDIRLSRIFHDTICRARSNFDTHGFTVHPLFLIVDPGHDPIDAHIPLRALLPAGLDGILVTGLGISAHRDAMPVIRMQADVQNQGYAAGMIAAMAPHGRIRALDIAAIQEPLIAKGILTPELRLHGDSFPLAEAEIEAALRDSVHDPERIDRVFTLQPDRCRERLRGALAAASTLQAQRHYAFALGVLGDPTGAEILAEEVAQTPWDTGWNYRGMGQFGASLSPLDARIIALGRCRTATALPVLLEKAESLPADAAFSHYRALAEALATTGDARAAPALAALLARPGIRGHAITSLAARLATATDSWTETTFRNRALIEISLASALHALDPGSTLATAILEEYARDVRGLFSKHARALLS